MKTSLPFLLLIFLASCSSSPKYVTWKRGTDSEIHVAATNSSLAEWHSSMAATNAAVSSTNAGTGYLEPATIPIGSAAGTTTATAVPANTTSGALTPATSTSGTVTITNAAGAVRTNVPPRPPFVTGVPPGTSISPRGPSGTSNAPPTGVMGATMAPATPAAAGTTSTEQMIPAGVIKFRGAPLEQVLEIYAKYRNRTLLFPANLNLQQQITLINQTDLTRAEVIEALNAVLALNGISMVDMDDKFVKVVAQGEVHTTGGPTDARDPSQFQSMGQYITRIVQLKYVLPTQMAQVLAPFAKIAGSIYPIDTSQILVLRDYTENIKRMLDMIALVDIAVPSEFISEVIPIKYAKASEIAEALGSLSGGGGSTSIGGGGQRSATGAGGAAGRGGTFMNRGAGAGSYPQGSTSPFGGAGVNPGGVNPGGAGPAAGSFNDRLNSIIRRAATGTGGLQIIGETKVINDDRSNSLLIFASRTDMETITNIIAKLDVVLAQVIIDSIIMDVQIGKAVAVGVSGLQKQNQFTQNLTGAGGYNNGQPIFDLVNFLSQSAASRTNTFFPGSLGGGLTYWAQIGKSYDLVLQAAETDERINVIQKPRIMTTHATPGSIFVGSTVPYVTSTYYNGGYGGGPSSQYQQMQVGIGLQVTPFINSEGLVVMQLHEEISEISGSTTITGVGDVPNTTTRQLDGEVSVRDGEAIMLGGFVRNSTDKKVSGIPILKDIPLIGPLFGNNSKTKARQELMVLMRPTVLRTPDIAAAIAAEEKQKMPGILNAEFEAKEDQRKMLEKEKKDEMNRKGLMKPSERNADQPQDKSDY
jgi:general secretion pathway protein D